MKTHRLAIVLVAALVAVINVPAMTKPAAKSRGTSAHTSKTETVVTKNADGTVEVSDQPVSGTSGITYKPAPPAVIHYADGVVVHRNADGSVDVGDDSTPEYHSFGPAPSAPRRHATTHSGSHKTPAKKSK